VVERKYYMGGDKSKAIKINITPYKGSGKKEYVAGAKGFSARGKTPAAAYRSLLKAGRGY
jgi:hypothetical protein